MEQLAQEESTASAYLKSTTKMETPLAVMSNDQRGEVGSSNWYQRRENRLEKRHPVLLAAKKHTRAIHVYEMKAETVVPSM